MTKSTFQWRHAYDPVADAREGAAAATSCEDESLTQQQFAEDADINVLVKRFGLEKVTLPVEAIDPRYYGDFTDVPDLRTALDRVNEATNRFMDLPAQLRSKFDNNPAKLWHFVNDPDNGPEAVRLGLLKPLQDETRPTPAEPAQGT